MLYPEGDDPVTPTVVERPYTFAKQNGRYIVRLHLPFAGKSDVDVFKKGDELVIQIGALRRHVGLPTSMIHLTPTKATLEEGTLIIEMKESV